LSDIYTLGKRTVNVKPRRLRRGRRVAAAPRRYDGSMPSDDRLDETTPCPACGEPVYDDADQCPRCGHWILDAERGAHFSGGGAPSGGGWFKTLLAVIGLILILLAVAGFLAQSIT